MGRPAVPKYMDVHIYRGTDGRLRDEISPGQRFGLLFPFWGNQEWKADPADKSKTNALKEVLPLSPESRSLLEAITSRQQGIAEIAGDAVMRMEAVSTAPFMTGIGNEHPLENGFSFLNPYGLPYLPGSAVKGILRRAAEELSSGEFGDTAGWQYPYVWLLFGFDAESAYLKGTLEDTRSPLDRDLSKQGPDALVSKIQETLADQYRDAVRKQQFDESALGYFMKHVLSAESLAEYQDSPGRFLLDLTRKESARSETHGVSRKEIHYRGALSFWDACPAPPENSGEQGFLRIEILTPHYGEYYQGHTSPADCGQPVPNPFLTIAPGCRFTFFVQCETARLPETLRGKWRPLLEQAFSHAFDWLGFGAKTAVGYGQMKAPLIAPSVTREAPTLPGSGKPRIRPPVVSTGTEIWDKASLSWKRNDSTLTATHPDGKRKTAPLKNPDRSMIPASLHQALFESKKPKPVYARVTVSIHGNNIQIVAIEPHEPGE